MGSVRVGAQRLDKTGLGRRQQLRKHCEVTVPGVREAERRVHVDADHVAARHQPQLALAGEQHVPGLVLLAADQGVLAVGQSRPVWLWTYFLADRKWQAYLGFCDRFYFAVDRDFPAALLPAGEGLIVADRFAGEIVREAPLRPLNAARRKAMLLRFARLAATRLHALSNPGV